MTASVWGQLSTQHWPASPPPLGPQLIHWHPFDVQIPVKNLHIHAKSASSLFCSSTPGQHLVASPRLCFSSRIQQPALRHQQPVLRQVWIKRVTAITQCNAEFHSSDRPATYRVHSHAREQEDIVFGHHSHPKVIHVSDLRLCYFPMTWEEPQNMGRHFKYPACATNRLGSTISGLQIAMM